MVILAKGGTMCFACVPGCNGLVVANPCTDDRTTEKGDIS